MRLIVTSVLFAAAASLSACDVCVDPGYEAKATDEAWLSLLDVEKTATVDDTKAALVSSPLSGAEASVSGTAPTFEWTTGLTAEASPPRLEFDRRSPSLWNELVWGSALAHGTPMAGPGHLVRLKVPGMACPLNHFTSLTAWTPTAGEWQKLTSFKGKTLTVDVLSAYFSSNRVTEGPYKPSAPVTLQLTP